MVLKAILFNFLLISAVYGQEPTTGPTTAPPADPCTGGVDVGFILDSSSSVGAGNFQLVRNFAADIVNALDVGPSMARISAARYNSWVDSSFFFNTHTTKAEVLAAIAAIPYYGRGTRTAGALKVFADHHLQGYSGWRGGRVPTVVVVLTDGRSQDSELLNRNAMLLRSKTTRVIAVGVGRAVASELEQIATQPPSENVIYVDDFDALADALRLQRIITRICDSLNDENECLVENGGCAHTCVNTYKAFYCECREGYVLRNGTECDDRNECLVDNGGCAQICSNTEGSFRCSCNEGYIPSPSGRFCVENSCFNNDECEQICNNIAGGTFSCSCRSGFTLNEDGRTCTDIDECAVNDGGCEEFCNNTAGSYFCYCPEGFGLRPDRRSCGLQCFTCNRAISNEDCLDVKVCQPNELSCQTETRRENGVLYISKQCKQTEACANNFIQNPRTAWSPSQCNSNVSGASVCRCCCHEALCNREGDCTPASTIDIECPDPYTLFDVVPPANLTCPDPPYMIGEVCNVVCPPGYEVVNGASELLCDQAPRTVDGVWRGVPGMCVDTNECLTDNGGCSHTCTNTNGSFICSCPETNPCQDQPTDLFFILDSSSSVGQGNFNLMIDFVNSFRTLFDFGQGAEQSRVGVMTYNNRATKRFDLKDIEDNDDFTERLRAIEYAGRGTRTAHAIRAAAQQCFTAARGRRAGIPLTVVVITDGRSKDFRQLPDAVTRMHAVTNEVFAIGVTNRVNEAELLQIVDNDRSNYRMIDNFDQLTSELMDVVGERICTQGEGEHFLASDGRTCDYDECSVDNGQCSDNCTNTVGSYYCSCPEGFLIGDDRLNCFVDNCAVDNGNCMRSCVNTNTGRNCLCTNEEMVVDETDCVDINECLDANAGCSDGCQNRVPGYVCTCPEGFILTADLETCEVDSCFNQRAPFICEHTCVNIPGGSYECRCNAGYFLNDDGHNCTEINECDVSNGGCEHTCTNTDGSFFCECPEGQALREDERTCGVVCYTCQNVLDNDECDTAVACAPDQDSCYTTMRTRNNITSITKGCQQRLACINNMLQNPRDAGEGPSQCNLNEINAKCECCCFESLCNLGLCPYDNFLPWCPVFVRENVVFRGLSGDDRVSAGGLAELVCPPGYQPSGEGDARLQLNCLYNSVNNSASWDGDPADLDFCVDINECDDNDGGCVEPADCVNLDGSYECVCPADPDDYLLIDGTICERDECADDDPPCSHNCTNTIGSFTCFCPPGLSLVEDGVTCDINECADGNGGCSQVCVNTLGAHRCECVNDGYVIASDNTSCIDVNECLTENGGCSDNCTNLDGGYECSCFEGRMLGPDGFNCSADPCFDDNGGCGDICSVNAAGEARCSCRPGYRLLADGSCIDINECAINKGGCEENCTNTDGSFICICPPGEGLHADGRTCGRACYSCNGLESNDECNRQPTEICPTGADACENEVRIHGGRKRIFKRCKQELSCNNNFRQNPAAAWQTSQCNAGDIDDVCRCCCIGHLCNSNERPCARAEMCDLQQADVTIIADSSSSVKYDNFQIMKGFIKSLLLSFNLGQGRVHAAMIRYNRRVEEIFNLARTNEPDDVADAVDATPYNGSGTRTGQAIQYVIDNILREANGQRPDVPQIVITLTDGRSQDSVRGPSEELRANGVITFAVGIGNINRDELLMIGGSEEMTLIVKDFDELSESLISGIRDAVCRDVNECDTDNGGCSHDCINLRGSYRCGCPAPLVLSVDVRTCFDPSVDPIGRRGTDECAENNGQCEHICTDLVDGFECSCRDGYSLREDGRTCGDLDECTNSNCSHDCVNTEGGYFCQCPEDHEISADQETCTPRPGPADCLAGWRAMGHSCLRANDNQLTYAEAETACAALGARLVKIQDLGNRIIIGRNFTGRHWIGLTDRDEEGTWVNSDGTLFTYPDGWASNEPGNGDCAYNQGAEYGGSFFASGCNTRRRSICEIPRTEGFLVFTDTWSSGAKGKLYFPTDVNTVRVIFPGPVSNFNVWFGKIQVQMPQSRNEFVISQDDIERQSSTGQSEYTLEMQRNRFPDYRCTVEPFP